MPDTTSTTAGAVRGAAGGGVVSFKGIPYGDDTSGRNRFVPARPPTPWTGVRDCLDYGASCPQVRVGQMMGMEMPAEAEVAMAVWNAEREMSEDCLVLNVWTPDVDEQAQRPVLVWLHGGGLSVGSASWPLYDFTTLAAKNDVVVVSVNHRIGVLGFLDVSHLDAELADSGNVGLLDIVTALEWVRDNIAGFGGDPANVTIFGESGGGSKVTALLAMPATRGLFCNAVAMSGAMLRARPPDLAQQTAETTMTQLGLADVSSLRRVEWSALISNEAERYAHAGPLIGDRPRGPFGPTLGPSLPDHPIDAVQGGSASTVNVLIGCTTHEGLLVLRDPQIWTGGDPAVRAQIHQLGGGNSDALLAAYGAARPDDSLLEHLVLMASDRLMRVPHIRYAEALDAAGGNVWMYLFDFRRELAPMLPPVAGHGSDMPYAFDNVHLAPIAQVPGADTVAAAVSGALVALARSGDPNHAGLPPWPRYSPVDRSTMRFDAPCELVDDPMAPQRRAWDGVDVGAGLG